MSKSTNNGASFSRKRRRGSAAKASYGSSAGNNSTAVCDLMIPLPKESAVIHVQEIRRRLAQTGFTHMAVTHTVFGAPKEDEDEAEMALPESLWLGDATAAAAKKKSGNKAPKQEGQEGNQQPAVKVLRRLNAVLESLSDVAQYTRRKADATDSASATTNQSAVLLQGYDLVSLSPRNDATFQSACKTASASDIIVLDYTSGRGGVQLPFKIRPADVKAAIARKAAFEIPYAPAILNRNQRKGLIQTCRLLHFASLGGKPKVILSSGSRMATVDGEAEDLGAMALRNPADLMNIMQVVMKLDSRMSFEALHTAGTFALQQAHLRRFGKQSLKITGISVVEDGNFEAPPTTKKPHGNGPTAVAASFSKKTDGPSERSRSKQGDSDAGSAGSDNGDDGFITF